MTIDDLLAANRSYAESPPAVTAAPPARRLAVVTCMDTRVDPLPALGLRVGDAHVMRNAGARVTGDVLRSLALSVHVLGVDTVVVMQHTNCGVFRASDADLRALTGAQLDFHPIDDHAESLRADVDQLAATPYLAPVRTLAGLLYDVTTGRVAEVVRRQR